MNLLKLPLNNKHQSLGDFLKSKVPLKSLRVKVVRSIYLYSYQPCLSRQTCKDVKITKGLYTMRTPVTYCSIWEIILMFKSALSIVRVILMAVTTTAEWRRTIEYIRYLTHSSFFPVKGCDSWKRNVFKQCLYQGYSLASPKSYDR